MLIWTLIRLNVQLLKLLLVQHIFCRVCHFDFFVSTFTELNILIFSILVIGLVDTAELKPGDLVGVNKDSYLVLEKLPPEYDSRVKAMEVDERPTETYSDIGGCDTQIKELIEAIVIF